jgi:tetratricopeptide (TPR) repeat protein
MKGGAAHADHAPDQAIEIARLSALAKEAYAEKDMDTALTLSSRILETEPENFVALRFLGRIHTQRGETGLAHPIWRRLLATGRDKVEAAVNLARIAYSRGDWREMAEFADLGVRADAGRTDALRLAITARVRAKQPEQLSEMLVRLHEAEPDRFFVVVKKLNSPELAQAQAAALVRVATGAAANGLLDAVTEDCRRSWETGAQRAASSKDDQIRAAYLRAIWTFDPRSRQAIDGLNSLSRDRLRDLRMAINNGDDDAALQQAESVAEFNPASFEAWFAIARLSLPNNPTRAAACFSICAKLNPADVYYRYRQGLALVKSDRVAEAILAFSDVMNATSVGSDPIAVAAADQIAGLGRTALNRAVAAARSGRLEEAQMDYRAANASANSRGGGYPVATHAIFWAYMLLGRTKKLMRDIADDSNSSARRIKRRFARLKKLRITRSANADAGSTRR